MPPHTKTIAEVAAEPNPNRPTTRSKTINVHPGTEAQNALRVNAPRREPAVIQEEKTQSKKKDC
jgi:hypothetical protein